MFKNIRLGRVVLVSLIVGICLGSYLAILDDRVLVSWINGFLWFSGGILVSVIMSVWISIHETKKFAVHKVQLNKVIQDVNLNANSEWCGVVIEEI